MTRYRLGIGPHLLDYIPYTDFRKFKVPWLRPGTGTTRPTFHAWLVNTRGLNILSACLDECSNLLGCKLCGQCTHVVEGLVAVALHGLSPDSVRNRKVQPEKDVELSVTFTVEWCIPMELDGVNWRDSAVRREAPHYRFVTEKRANRSKSFWDTVLSG